ncbi:transcription factor IIEbeta [Brevipalpus obovatus]|uniref:transcription factor IIEbeta n=1 Tax=Brevipalpus obovatus TaxID=246614 RepID=UPI003D9F75CE
MDPALLKAREDFKKKALNNPTVEKKKKSLTNGTSTITSSSSANDGPSAAKKRRPPPAKEIIPFNYKTHVPASSHNFATLSKIVMYMRKRYLEGDTEALTIDDMLDETNQLDVSQRQRQWLTNEALKNNPKIEVLEEGAVIKYKYKPKFKLENKSSLLRLLDKYDREGLGGITYEDVQESLPYAEKIINLLKNKEKIIIITRPADKKRILFYNDTNSQLKVDEEFQKMWRSVAVDGLDEQKIEEYLEKHGITSMQELGSKKVVPIQRRKKPTSKKPKAFKKLNDHMGDTLIDYS